MTPLSILIVDDHSVSADLLGIVMGMEFPEATVHVAYGGQAGLELAHRSCPDAVVLDLEMPGMHGEMLAVALRAVFGHNTPLLIALSGNVQLLDAVRQAGAFDHRLSKPVDIETLVGIVKKHVPSLSA